MSRVPQSYYPSGGNQLPSFDQGYQQYLQAEGQGPVSPRSRRSMPPPLDSYMTQAPLSPRSRRSMPSPPLDSYMTQAPLSPRAAYAARRSMSPTDRLINPGEYSPKHYYPDQRYVPRAISAYNGARGNWNASQAWNGTRGDQAWNGTRGDWNGDQDWNGTRGDWNGDQAWGGQVYDGCRASQVEDWNPDQGSYDGCRASQTGYNGYNGYNGSSRRY